ncbi:PREDICTED: inactive pancreatic lipase-related protein 1-like [Priapulus caudatus]|uniref:Inactive pancreatic lipase-related protein 1-like n=1 Tax=Priapulus caudatus TaxID=37621 RepID=A0ABM1ERT2_PRICU|nr:PREDICTED: inactive pancreatic lipase-related protein 1-like [Priapulus caudatus]
MSFLRVALAVLAVATLAYARNLGPGLLPDSSIPQACDGGIQAIIGQLNISLVDIIDDLIGGSSRGLVDQLPSQLVTHLREELEEAKRSPMDEKALKMLKDQIRRGELPDFDMPIFFGEQIDALIEKLKQLLKEILADLTLNMLFRCYDDYGCFTKIGWYSRCRMINQFPDAPREVDVQYKLYTRANLPDPTVGNAQVFRWSEPEKIKESFFNPKKETKILIHGFRQATYENWLWEMGAELLAEGDYNVIVVDWQKGAAGLYAKATANARLVGKDIQNLYGAFGDVYGALKVSASRFHLIGYAMGAHVAGYAGGQGRGIRFLGRITGMDPTDPSFQWTNAYIRLDESDASFVDVIHSDSKGWNEYVHCNHRRAHDLFIDSIRSTCPYRAFECESQEQLEAGECDTSNPKTSARIGMHAVDSKSLLSGRKNVAMFITTGDKNPFCLYHLQFEVAIASNNPIPEEGRMYVRVTNELGSSEEYGLGDHRVGSYDLLTPGKTHRYLVQTDRDWKALNQLEFRWESSNWIGKKYLHIDTIKVTSTDSNTMSRFCLNGSKYQSVKNYNFAPSLECAA